MTRAAVEVLPVRVKHVDRADMLPSWHGDPFDRMLVAQALVEGCTLISCDGIVARHGATSRLPKHTPQHPYRGVHLLLGQNIRRQKPQHRLMRAVHQ